MKPADRRSALVFLAVAGAAFLILAAFLALGVWAWATEPAHQIDLPGTRWAVVAIDDQSAGSPAPVLAFDGDGNYASLTLSCGTVKLAWAWDTDGAAQRFGIDAIPASCETSPSLDRAVLDAILGAEEWSVQGAERIKLSGVRELRLERNGPAD